MEPTELMYVDTIPVHDEYPFTPLEDPDVVSSEQSSRPQRIPLCRCKRCHEDKIPWRRNGMLCTECHTVIEQSRRKQRNRVSHAWRKNRQMHNRSIGLCACGREPVYERTCKECYLKNKKRRERRKIVKEGEQITQ